MKLNMRFFYILTATALLTACSTSDSETLKRARTIQDETLKGISSLDSTLSAKLSSVSSEMSVLSTDSTMATDSLKIKAFDALKLKQTDIEELKTEMADWKKGIALLPSSEEIANGAANPFGDKAKDQDVLAALKKTQEDLSSWKSKVASAVK